LPSLPELRALVPAPASKSVPVTRMAQASENLSAAVATRRRQRQGFTDSNFVADSFFDDEAPDVTISSFGRIGRGGVSVREIDFSGDNATAAVVTDTPPAALRH
jgi:hypothetical protein